LQLTISFQFTRVVAKNIDKDKTVKIPIFPLLVPLLGGVRGGLAGI
jgi:hypothetical protein